MQLRYLPRRDLVSVDQQDPSDESTFDRVHTRYTTCRDPSTRSSGSRLAYIAASKLAKQAVLHSGIQSAPTSFQCGSPTCATSAVTQYCRSTVEFSGQSGKMSKYSTVDNMNRLEASLSQNWESLVCSEGMVTEIQVAKKDESPRGLTRLGTNRLPRKRRRVLLWRMQSWRDSRACTSYSSGVRFSHLMLFLLSRIVSYQRVEAPCGTLRR